MINQKAKKHHHDGQRRQKNAGHKNRSLRNKLQLAGSIFLSAIFLSSGAFPLSVLFGLIWCSLVPFGPKIRFLFFDIGVG